ncbi:MAG: hypothetical protein AAF288_10135 [Planctomycetota bacterium]
MAEWVVISIMFGMICGLLTPPVLFAGLLILTALKIKFVAMAPTEQTKALDEFNLDTDFLSSQGFQFEGGYTLEGLLTNSDVLIWRQRTDPAFFFAGLGPGMKEPSLTFLSILSWKNPEIGINTNDAKFHHVIALEREDYMQTFSDRDLPTLWRLHQEAEGFVAQRHDMEVNPLNLETTQVVTKACRDTVRRLLFRPWHWPKYVWRYWVGQNRRHNKTVADLN